MGTKDTGTVNNHTYNSPAQKTVPTYTAQWEVETDNGWSPYTKDNNRIINDALRNGKTCEVKYGYNHKATVDPNQLTQKNEKTNVVRRIRKIGDSDTAPYTQPARLYDYAWKVKF